MAAEEASTRVYEKSVSIGPQGPQHQLDESPKQADLGEK
jgi:hypothetical protein